MQASSSKVQLGCDVFFRGLQAINEQIEKMPDEYFHLDENVMWQVCFKLMLN